MNNEEKYLQIELWSSVDLQMKNKWHEMLAKKKCFIRFNKIEEPWIEWIRTKEEKPNEWARYVWLRRNFFNQNTTITMYYYYNMGVVCECFFCLSLSAFVLRHIAAFLSCLMISLTLFEIRCLRIRTLTFAW